MAEEVNWAFAVSIMWYRGHPTYRKEENSDIEGEEKEETERDRTQGQ